MDDILLSLPKQDFILSMPLVIFTSMAPCAVKWSSALGCTPVFLSPEGARPLTVPCIPKHADHGDAATNILLQNFFFFLKILFIHERHREREREAETQAPFRETDVGLDPGSPGSHPGLKAALNR